MALVGVLGFVVWKNFINKPATPAATSTNSGLTTLNISELGVGVLYDKSLPAISYTFHKASNGVAGYADVTSQDLVGTSCVGDIGSIAQVIQNPTSTSNFSESPIVATVTINSTKYVLTLSGSNCTNDKTLLSQYQSSIEKNFLNLKAE